MESKATRVAFWWIVELISMCACGCSAIALTLESAYVPLMVVFVLWFAFTHMHEGLSLEAVVQALGQAHQLYRRRRLLLLRLVTFYFVVLSLCVTSLLLSSTAVRDYITVVPVALVLAVASLRLLFLQRRYLRLRAEELAAE